VNLTESTILRVVKNYILFFTTEAGKSLAVLGANSVSRRR
jgi:hypothetical protein